MRIHLFEFEDFKWFPNIIREGGTDYLRYILNALKFYKPIVPIILDGLNKTGDTFLVDIASGGGGNIEQIQTELCKAKPDIRIVLTDKYPNIKAYQYIQQQHVNVFDYVSAPVDATNVPESIKGYRVMFSAIHHFKPQQVKEILQSAVDAKQGIAIFDGGDKNILTILGILIIHPILFLVATPFFKPFRISRLLFTYVLPLIPLYTIWDGMVSILRLYTPTEMLHLAEGLNGNYEWKAGKVKNGVGMHIAYLTGVPKDL